jgi:hypothetical protein
MHFAADYGLDPAGGGIYKLTYEYGILFPAVLCQRIDFFCLHDGELCL